MDWEDDPPAETPPRRVQKVIPRIRKSVSDQPDEAEDADDEAARPKARRSFADDDEAPSGPWWHPVSSIGKAFLALSVLTVLGAVTAGGLELKKYLDQDNRFRIAGSANIQASGLSEVSRAELLPVFGADIGKNIFFVRLDERRRELEAIPWVERATVMRVLPDQLRITVVERKPVAFTRNGQQIGLVDADGVLLTMPAAVMAERHYSFPVVTGLDPSAPPAARRVRMAVYTRLLAELDANHQRFSDQISEIDLTDPEDARVLMQEQGSDILVHFGDERFLERYRRYKTHIGDWRQQFPQLSAVDLRYEQQAVLKMGRSTPPTAADSNAQSAAASAPAAATSAKPAPLPVAAAPATPEKRVASQEKAARGNASKEKPALKAVASSSATLARKNSAARSLQAADGKQAKSADKKRVKTTDKKLAKAADKADNASKDRKTARTTAQSAVAAKSTKTKTGATDGDKLASHQKLTQAQKDLVEKFRVAQQKRHVEQAPTAATSHAAVSAPTKHKTVSRPATAGRRAEGA
jgi:cell division protein FtsQ